MITKKINNTILVSSRVAVFAMKMGFAVFFAKLLWWLITPTYNEIYVDRTRINQKDSATKYIINRYPFGETVITKTMENKPLFSSLVRLHGVYDNGDNSMAFVNYSGTNKAVKVGDSISDDIFLTQVNANDIIITQNGINATIEITKSDQTPNSKLKSGSGDFSPNNSQVNSANDSNMVSDAGDNGDLMERRREMIERFAKQEVNDGSSNPGTPVVGNQ